MFSLELLKLPTPVLLVWGLPEDFCTNTDIACFIFHYWTNEGGWSKIDLPEGNWHLIGKLSELTDTECCKIVDISIHTGLSALYTKGVNPPNVYCYESALDSFHSAIETEGYFVTNNLTDPELTMRQGNCSVYYGASEQEFQEYADREDKTLPANTLIFKRV